MLERLKAHWYKLPRSTRRPVVFIVGFFFILLSGLIGWLPGPGGMPPFILGIAILATEFAWAIRFRDLIIDTGRRLMLLAKRYPVLIGIIAAICIGGFWLLVYAFVYKR
jgi:hypothetical protein